MTIPAWALLGFAVWTLLLLFATVGVYRLKRIFTGQVEIKEYAEYTIEGQPWYRRAMRAHANCVENLPVFGALVVVLLAANIEGTLVDVFALLVIGARVPHSVVHVAFEQTNRVAFLRWLLFVIQWISMLALAVVIVSRLA